MTADNLTPRQRQVAPAVRSCFRGALLLPREPMAALSPREMEVARLVAEDLPDKQIATRLDISVRTVQEHLDRIGKKLGAGQTVKRRRAISRWVEAHCP